MYGRLVLSTKSLVFDLLVIYRGIEVLEVLLASRAKSSGARPTFQFGAILAISFEVKYRHRYQDKDKDRTKSMYRYYTCSGTTGIYT